MTKEGDKRVYRRLVSIPVIAWLKASVRRVIALVVHAYLLRVRLDREEAERWAIRMKRWPAILATPPLRRAVRVAGGFQMKVGLVDLIERSLWVDGFWEAHVLKFLETSVKPGDVVIDVGANIGMTTLFASSLVGPTGKVVAVEPSIFNLGRLCEHLWLNRIENVAVLSSAAGGDFGLGMIAFPGAGNAGAATMRGAPTGAGHPVLVAPLDAWIESAGLAPALIKIDIEGFELHALRGLERTLTSAKPLVVLELTDAFLREAGHDARSLVRFMEELGYECRSLVSYDDRPPGDLISSDSERFPEGQVDVYFAFNDGRKTS